MGTPRILLVVGGGIAAYKSCELVRLIRKGGGEVTCVLTDGGAKFVTAMALAALSENPVHTTLWDLRNEVEMGHIQLSRQADLVVVCPATANMLAKMAAGIADDLATTLLLATDKPVMAVPAMNVRMWQHAATVRNVETLRAAGVDVMEPNEGAMACGEYGAGRLPEPEAIWARIAAHFGLAAPQPIPAAQIETQPEDEGLGGLSAAMIVRTKKKAPLTLGEAPLEDAEYVAFAAEAFGDPAFLEPLPAEEAPPLDLGGPLLSKKGKARAAPPTDAEAINHIVSHHGDAMAPQPFVSDPFLTDPLAADPLEGQPEFDDDPAHRPLHGRHVIVTAGPTHEPIDPVR